MPTYMTTTVAHFQTFRKLMKGFNAYVLWPLAKKFQNWIVDRSTALDFTVFIVTFSEKVDRQKKSQPRNWFGNRGCLKVLNNTKLVLRSIKDPLIYDQFGIIQNIQTPSVPQTNFLVGFCHFLQQGSSSNTCKYLRLYGSQKWDKDLLNLMDLYEYLDSSIFSTFYLCTSPVLILVWHQI